MSEASRASTSKTATRSPVRAPSETRAVGPALDSPGAAAASRLGNRAMYAVANAGSDAPVIQAMCLSPACPRLTALVQRRAIQRYAADRYEVEADRMADHVMSGTRSDPPAIQPIASTHVTLQRAEAEEDDDVAGDMIDREFGLQGKAAPGAGRTIAGAAPLPASGGAPLPAHQRAFLEPRFGRDLRGVRIHTDSGADQSARSLGALAYAQGPHVVFRSGEYSPASANGGWLLAHELTHVAQQGHAPAIGPAAPAVAASPDGTAQFFPDPAVPTQRAIDESYAQSLDDHDLNEAIAHVQRAVDAHTQSSDYTDALYANLKILQDERFARDNRTDIPKDQKAPPAEEEDVDFDESEFDVENENWKVEEPRPGLIRGDPANLWDSPTAKVNPTSLPMNTKLIAYSPENGRTRVELEGGRKGWVASHLVETKLPDPDAELHMVQGNETAQTIARQHYSAHAKEWGQDERFFVNVLYYTNQLFPAQGKDSGITRPANRKDEWDATTVKKDHRIWIPGVSFALGLKDVVSSGSTSYEMVQTVKELFIGTAGLLAGILVGALESIVDIFVGLWDLIKMAWSLIKSLITGSIISDAKQLWESLSKLSLSDLVDAGFGWLKAKWSSDGKSTWSTWYDRGWLIGYIVAEIALMIFSGGAATALKWAGKSAKFVKLLEKLPTLAKYVKRVEEAGALKAGADLALDGLRLGAKALTKAHQWAQTALRIPFEIIKDTSEAVVQRLQKLSGWAKDKFRHLTPGAMKAVLGCASPCKIDIHEIEEYFRKLAPVAGKAAAKLGANVEKILAALPPGLNKTLIAEKLKTRPALKMLIEAAELTADDFAKMADFAITTGDKASAAMSYRTFVRYLTAVVPAKAGGDIKKFNKIAEAIIKTSSKNTDKVNNAIIRQGSALKGSMFEGFARLNFPELGGKEFSRITFNQSATLKLEKVRRTADSFVEATGELWEVKHTVGKVPADQIADYTKILKSGGKVTSVNYIFPTEAVAKLNKDALQKAGFVVRYVDDAGKLAKIP